MDSSYVCIHDADHLRIYTSIWLLIYPQNIVYTPTFKPFILPLLCWCIHTDPWKIIHVAFLTPFSVKLYYAHSHNATESGAIRIHIAHYTSIYMYTNSAHITVMTKE